MKSPAERSRAGRPLVVQIGEWRRHVGTRLTLDRTVRADELDDELVVSGSHVEGDEPIVVRAVLEIVSAGVVATGTAHTRWRGECRRCLSEAIGELTAEFTELCVEDPEDDATYRLDDFELDLEPVVHDACILELPLAPLCSPDCLGLCPDCGVDRNRESCQCTPASNGRWAGLAGLYEEVKAPAPGSSSSSR
jgi:uncharacterized protein